MSVLLCVLLLCTQTFGLEELTVMSGRDATLHLGCSDGEVTLIEWTRSDLQPLKYVFLYRNARSYANYQNPGYRGRVELRNPEIKDGDVSITVKNVSVDDAGLYKCRTIVKENGNSTEFRKDINLRVTDSGESEGQTSSLVWDKENEDEENKVEEKSEAAKSEEGKSEEGKSDERKSEEGKSENSVALIAGVSVTVGIVCVGIIVLVLSKKRNDSKKSVPSEANYNLI
ncbi:myelin P0-like [Solea senegalensis]|uniref:Myelin P0-like n=1 Tax=Solea senegalensis TaxID=28829 RepID=A0AAV6QRU4_SOLSE|nr:butyrophilin subfamily 1 member A1-like isoform X1 [Solea senegalensis]KAG7496121.1 myelin P0-like [Solea senegalensis]